MLTALILECEFSRISAVCFSESKLFRKQRQSDETIVSIHGQRKKSGSETPDGTVLKSGTPIAVVKAINGYIA